jgi:hypothetical protein
LPGANTPPYFSTVHHKEKSFVTLAYGKSKKMSNAPKLFIVVFNTISYCVYNFYSSPTFEGKAKVLGITKRTRLIQNC